MQGSLHAVYAVCGSWICLGGVINHSQVDVRYERFHKYLSHSFTINAKEKIKVPCVVPCNDKFNAHQTYSSFLRLSFLT